MSWEIVLGLITISGAMIALGTILYRLAAVITKLEVTVNSLTNWQVKVIDKQEDTERTVDRHEITLVNHEKRITKLEDKKVATK